ncbi:MAG: carboxypeptidase regulatory-like domain-containing protein [Saprospiraceae bacterium]|nr:carboxypeptidase regulatory-like domain-containing protein [Saprospiraceae bacterium]
MFTLAATQLSGQSTGKISGKITDSRTPLEFVTVTAAPLSDSTQVLKYFVTDSLGFFTLEGLPFDTYKLECRLIGTK